MDKEKLRKLAVSLLDDEDGIPSDAFDRQILQWLVSDGYPQSEIDDYGDHFYCRFYEMEVIE